MVHALLLLLRLLLLLVLLMRMQMMLLLGNGHSAHQTDGSDIKLVVTETRRMRLKLFETKIKN
jgi:hypothetical protein